ncbi:unnamed protein product [Tilletia caries]|uniref:Uncharacterized protein n=3 Tax=Tilletia TaxID=13289 RepID=A0A177VGX0_9BASI|nr:hypothetical protein CF336_g5839 [Tilletia laevis]KAE8195440.1 hypothetical protein CF335_g5100 [Tilletia laevis]KAE8255663.1 hypothetical protein A4X03_0g5526 [Tilletia caries]CAD6962912.1 unnamed protein product [Tilletia caries]
MSRRKIQAAAVPSITLFSTPRHANASTRTPLGSGTRNALAPQSSNADRDARSRDNLGIDIENDNGDDVDKRNADDKDVDVDVDEDASKDDDNDVEEDEDDELPLSGQGRRANPAARARGSLPAINDLSFLDNNDDNFDDLDDDFDDYRDESLDNAGARGDKRKRSNSDEARPEYREPLPPTLQRWADRFELGPDARDLLEDRYQLAMSMKDDGAIPSSADIFDWARDLATWDQAAHVKIHLEQALNRIDELTEEVRGLKKETMTMTKVDLRELGKKVAFVFFSDLITEYSASSNIVGRTMKFLKECPEQVTAHFKELIEDADVCDSHIEPKVRQLVNRMRDMGATRLHKSLGIDDGTERQSGHELWGAICTGYSIPFTKKRGMRLIYMRYIATRHHPREKNGRPVGDFWETIDETLKAFRHLQERDSEAATKELEAIWKNDQKRFGTFEYLTLKKADAKREEALFNAMRAR